jgi:exo-beta-1,3-glucanase (GH17 family)/cellulose synthase/poly-beta-1,6-N-acetylglucosamine synthase-like glycosyltransferase
VLNIFKDRKLSNIAVLVGLAAIVIAGWAYYNKPISAPPWPEHIPGFSYSPFRDGQGPIEKVYPTRQQIRDDMKLLSRYSDKVRMYTLEGNLTQIPNLAAEQGMQVTLGVWLSDNKAENAEQMARAIEVANSSKNVNLVVVGNETQYRNALKIEELIQYVDAMRMAVRVPVTTAETWDVWVKHPELVDHVDVIAAHILPYWENFSAEFSLEFVSEKAGELKKMFPHKPLLLAEVGWPSRGRARGDAEASRAEQAVYLRNLVNRLNQEGYDFFVIEAFDQPWKRISEGDVGAYWGVFDVDRNNKFPFAGDIVNIPQWQSLVAASLIVAVLAFALLLIDGSELLTKGRTFLAAVAFACATLLVVIAYDYSNQYITVFGVFMGIFLALGAIGIVIVLFTEAHELAEAAWIHKRRRPFSGIDAEDAYRPKVSVHVPCYNEPPDMLMRTLDALAALDYPDYEVIVIDNNTKDPGVWQPVQAYCETLGEKFRFFHVSPLAGFKAGALNFALKQTAPDAEVIAVIDSDYCVRKDWLRHLVPHFENPNIGLVQAPQDYSDADETLFKTLCYSEYKGFFQIGMVTRNDRDAIIQHGTMTMVRRTVMDELGWAEWCICEDSELGLRVFQKGLSAAYVSESYGKGLMPDTFVDYKKQRFRWAYGAVQILKKHSAELFRGKNTQLTLGQRYHFIAGWLPWLADGLNVFYTLGAIMYATAMIIAPRFVDPPQVIFALPPLALFLFKVGKILFVYRMVVKVSLVESLSAALAGLALSHSIAKAIIYGVFTSSMPFFRTPKMASNHGIMRAFGEAREEIFIMLLLWAAAFGIAYMNDTSTWDVKLWIFVLLMQSISYFAALVMALLSAMPTLGKKADGIPQPA